MTGSSGDTLPSQGDALSRHTCTFVPCAYSVLTPYPDSTPASIFAAVSAVAEDVMARGGCHTGPPPPPPVLHDSCCAFAPLVRGNHKPAAHSIKAHVSLDYLDKPPVTPTPQGGQFFVSPRGHFPVSLDTWSTPTRRTKSADASFGTKNVKNFRSPNLIGRIEW